MNRTNFENIMALIFGSLCILCFGALAIWGLRFEFTHTVSVIVLFILGLVALFFIGTLMWTFQESESASAKMKLHLDQSASLVDRHIETLARQRIQLIRNDRYGMIDTSRWDAEMQSFVDKVLFPELITKDKNYASSKKIFSQIFHNLIEEKAKLRASAIESELSFSNEMSPLEFENWCTKIISSNGWVATTTKATGDQGADVVAEKGRTRLVLQCKLYSSPVGNKAVQEAFAAQKHYMANASAVVTNATFTPSAVSLAATTGVQLLHYTDLTRLNDS